MLNALSSRHQTKIAWFFFFLFYADFVMAGTGAKQHHNNSRLPFFESSRPALGTPKTQNSFPGVSNNAIAEAQQQNNLQGQEVAPEQIGVKAGLKEEEATDPGQPEMQSFKSIGTDNMVDLFTGDFSYNIPLLDVGGYPVNIFYNSGLSMDQEASWVGLGWNINPGTISRNMRGLPDDFDGSEKVTKTMSIKEDITVGANVSIPTELGGFPIKLSVGAGLFYNNYKGFGLEESFGLSIASKTTDTKTAGVTAGLSAKFNSQQGSTISPSIGINIFNTEKGTTTGISTSVGYNSRVGVQSLQLSGEVRKYSSDKKYERMTAGLFGGGISFAQPSVSPSIKMPISRTNFNVGASVGSEKFFIYRGLRASGYYSIAKIADGDKTQSKPAYGFLHMEKGQKDDNALMDFNRLNEGVYTPNSPVISIPAYTYDVYSMSGEGTGGSFRPYRGDIGYVKDHYSKTRDNAFSVDAELGLGKYFEAGVNLHAVFSPTEAGEWKTDNLARSAFRFHGNDSIYQGVYFRNPSEKTIGNDAFVKAMGDDDLVRIKLEGTTTAYPKATAALERFGNNRLVRDTIKLTDDRTTKHQREKRSQVISYLTAEEASHIGLDTMILSYPLNQFPIGGCRSNLIDTIKRYQTGINSLRALNHISEIDVVNPDGRRYVYGLPVYNLEQKESSFATETLPTEAGQIVTYSDVDNSPNNKWGRDNFFQRETMPAYAHSFLLTGLLSTDYVDVKGDGITEDDLGDAVKFNYTQIKKASSDGAFNWRAPYTRQGHEASFNEGLKTDRKDNKASFTSGTRELWYLNSIESKNMVATFTVGNRWDAKEAAKDDKSETGTSVDGPGMKRLERIDLYSKADWIKNGTNAKPIKSVHFEYSYKLCQQVPSNINNVTSQKGKLTLDNIWFSYNGNNKARKNLYRFNYDNNPIYDRSANDRWGNYKPVKDAANTNVNLGGMNNADYPYSVQDKTQADKFAAAWTLDEIRLPSGGKINVSYEADDYAYVQNRRAQQMFRIAGLGKDKNDIPQPSLYKRTAGGQDYFCIFIDAQRTVTDADAKRYFEGVRQLYMKLFVTMPSDSYGSGQEAIPVYAEIKDYGVSTRNGNLLYVNVLPVRESYSPMASGAIQFLRDYLPSKAFPGSDIKLESGPKQVLLAVKGMMNAVANTFTDFEKGARSKGICFALDINRSFIRLNNPDFKKLGGGLRVKRIAISDSWEEMTRGGKSGANEAGMQTSTYGQEYDYSTTKEVDGKMVRISSGVATYEPGIGAEENPFREILRYSNKQPLGPTQSGATEVPIAEMFYPSPMVGYGKVTVRSVNRDNVKSGVGKQVSEFYTSKDFPVLSDFTDFDNTSKVNFKSNPILQLLKLDVRQTTTLTQGFRVQLNDMNGKMKSQTSFAEDTSTIISYSANYYRLQQKSDSTYQLTNNVLAVKGSDGAVTETQIGREVEMMVDFREHNSRTITTNLDLNLNVSGVGPFIIPLPSLVPPVAFEEAIYRSATVMKVVNRYGILDSVVSIDKGSQVTTRDMVYDGETGNVLLTRTNNEFNAPVYNFNYPAHWAYSGMHPAYRNIDLTYKGLTFRHGILISSLQVNTDYLESGDEIYVKDYGASEINDTEACGLQAGGDGCTPPSPISKSYEHRIWALDITKDKSNKIRQFVFIDRNGNPYSADAVTMRVVRSGKRNMLNESVGTVTSRFSPLITENGQLKVKPQNSNEIINTAATTYKERWRVESRFYVQTTTHIDSTPATVYHKTLFPDAMMNLKGKFDNTQLAFTQFEANNNPEYFEAWRRFNVVNGVGTLLEAKTYMKFDFTSIPVGAKILSSTINLYPHLPSYVDCKGVTGGFNHTNLGYAVHDGQYSDVGNIDRSNLTAIGTFFPSTWYSPSDPAWQSIFLNWATGSGRAEYFTTRPAGQVHGSNAEQNLDAKSIVQLLSDQRSMGNAGITGMFLSLYESPTANNQTNTCFTGTGSCYQPKLDISYYVCGSSPESIAASQSQNGSQTNAQISGGGTVYCTTESTSYQCVAYEDATIINPYTRGLLGNWRTERAYTYYGNRREKMISAGSSLDLRTAGAIEDFNTYWNFDSDSLRTGGSSKWVWNSEITQFNKRGFEIENHDPLGRYNSGLYGYAQALPVAVANNAKHREIAFDGFEDYDYKSSPCAVPCQIRHLNIIDESDNTHLSSDAHSGKNSLKLSNGENIRINSEVVLLIKDTASYGINIRIDTAIVVKTTVDLRGLGWFQENYWDENLSNFQDSYVVPRLFDSNLPAGGYSKRWKAIYMPSKTGVYSFVVNSDDGARLFISSSSTNRGPNLLDIRNSGYWSEHGPFDTEPVLVNMTIGVPMYIEMEYYNHDEDDDGGSVSLMLKKPCETISNLITRPDVYPPSQSSEVHSGTIKDTLYCVRPKFIQPQGNYITDNFSMLQGKQMVFSAWVKEPENCNSAAYTNNQVTISFKDGEDHVIPSATRTFQPYGAIIEGWQRYDSVFTVPSSAVSCEMSLQNTGGGTVLFDDLRIHPFNANMKSFVYHPTNLRLMAELDENNYASFYEYDDDGTLVRVKKETIKGIKTINETRSALQKSIQ